MSLSMDDRVVQTLVAARVTLLFNDPWYGNLVTRLALVECADTDAFDFDYRQLRFSRRFVANQTPTVLEGALRKVVDELVERLPALVDEGQDITVREFIAALANATSSVGTDRTPRLALEKLAELGFQPFSPEASGHHGR